MKKYLKYLLVFVAVIMFTGSGKVQAQSLKISASAGNMYVKQKIQMKITPSSMKGKVKWKSSDKKIASVSKGGLVTAKKPGKVKIYAISLKNSKTKAVYQIKVQAFKKKSLQADSYAVKSVSGLLPTIGKKYRVFHSRKEIDEYLKAGEEKDGYIAYGIESGLKNYKKSFFKNKCLCIAYISTEGSGSTPVRIDDVQLLQNTTGKVTAEIKAEIGVQGPDEMWTCDVAVFYAVLELDKKDAERIQNYNVEKMYADPPIVDY